MSTIGDVAARAKVSTATVSRVLNGKRTVHPDLAQRVTAAANELAYQPHGPARNLRRRQTTVFGVIVPDVRDPFSAAIARGVEDVAEAKGYSVMLGDSDDDPEKERRYLDTALREAVAGLVLCPTNPATDLTQLLSRGVPVVVVANDVAEPRCDRILLDTRAAARHATESLIDEGYQRIGCITPAHPTAAAAETLAGYRDALASSPRLRGPELKLPASDAATARDQAARVLGGPNSPDAVLVPGGAVAVGVVEAAAARGMKLGKDIGVIVLDNPAWASLTDPPLSVLDRPGYEVGAAAARLALAKIGRRGHAPFRQVVRPRLMTRGSSQRRNGS